MADKTIGDLTQAASIGSEDLFVLEQNSEAKKLKGSQLVKYAQDAVGAQVTAATQAAENAAAAKTGAESAQTQAQAARDAILNMLVEAITLEQGSPATVEKSIVGSAYKLTFGLPSGKKGDPGATGPANTLTIGTVTSGIEASATITGEAPNQVLNLVLQRGEKGDSGVYVGAGDMPEGYNVQIDPSGSGDEIVTAESIKSALGYTPADSAALSMKQDKPIIKTAMDEIAVAGAQYYLGEQTAVDIVFPDDAQIGQMITFCWYNGATAATLSITGTMLAFDYTPSANTRSEINALWDGIYWAVLGNEMEVPSDAETA